MKIFQRERISIVAGWIGKRFIAPITFTGGCNKEVFNAWLEQILLPQLQPGTTIVMDNATFHKTPTTRSLIESFGCHLLYLPTYSPDLNPHFYPQIKKRVKWIPNKFGIKMSEVSTNVQYTDGLGDKWLERELKHVNLGDTRLNKRLIKTGYCIEGKASGSINQSCSGWKEAKGAYRLFSNEKLKDKEIYSSHYKETMERMKGNQFVFSVQDTSYLDFDSHIKTKRLGSISKAYTKHKMGLLLHSALIVSKDGLPLGLSSQQCWARSIREKETSQEKANRKYRTSIEEKESYKWITALKESINNLPANVQLVTLGDREADIFKFLWITETLGSFYVIRNRTNRRFICTEIGKTDLQTRITQLPVKKKISLEVNKGRNQRSRKANIEVKYMKGYIPIRSSSIYGSKDRVHKISDKIPVYVVSAKETNPPEGLEAIDWTLLTNVPVNSTLDAIERINWYKLRWKIEEYFRVLKSGCKIESSRLTTKERLQKLIAIKSIIAFKILYLTKVALSNPMETCTKILSNEEWKALFIREHKVATLPEEPPNIKQAIIWLGKLGGFMSAPSKVRKVQLVKIRLRQSLANSLKRTIMLRKVTSVVKLVEWTTQGTTKVKVLSPEILDVIEVDTFHIVEDSKKGNNKASYHSLYRDLRPYHVLRWSLRKLGRSFVFLLRYVGTSQQRRVLTEDTKEVGLIDSTQSVGKPHTRGSGQQYSDWFRNCYANTTEVGITCKEN